MSGKTGCRRGLFIGGVGCISLVILMVGAVGLALVWGGVSYRRMGAPTADPAERTVPLGPVLAGGDAGAGEAVLSVAPTPVDLTIEMMEGEFQVEPGPSGSEILVEGTFASKYYELEEERSGDEFGRKVGLRLVPTAGFFTRVLAGLTDIGERHPNRLTVFIPEDLPVALTLRMSAGGSRCDLGGLTLTGLDVEFSKGDHRLDISRPVRAAPDQAVIKLEMGDGKLSNLGNGRFRNLQVNGRMGSFRVDLGGAWEPGSRSEVSVSHSMSDLTLLIPREVRVDRDSFAVFSFGESNASALMETGEKPADAPVLKIGLSTSMGGANIRRF
jgi:hypothetical protein